MLLNRSRLLSFCPPSLIAVILLLGLSSDGVAKVGIRCSFVDSLTTNYLVRRFPKGLSLVPHPLLQPPSSTVFVLKTEVDSVFQRVFIHERVFEEDIRPPTVLTYDQYRDLRFAYDTQKAFRENTVKVFKFQKKGTSGQGIAIDVPFRIKSRTFKRIFGGERVGLRVSGDISINGHVRRQKFSQIQTINNQNASTSFLIDQTQRFTIEGKVGEKVKVRVDQDSERLFDFQNAIRLDYTGEEDEVIQSIEAGNIDMRLGTRLATFSGRNQGLFGLKSTAKLGALTMTGIASMEKGQKNKQRPNTAAGQARPPFSEKDFLRGVYFFLSDTTHIFTDVDGREKTLPPYRYNYRHFINRTHVAVDSLLRIASIQVYVSSETYPGGQSSTPLPGKAVSWPYLARPQLDDSLQGNQEHQSGQFRRLDYGSGEYDFDRALGYIRLRSPVGSADILAVAFSTAHGDTFGTLIANPDSVRLLLLKPENPQPSDTTWNLMFRHVYSLNAQDIAPDNFKMEIVRSASSSSIPETGLPGFNETYLTTFRFDMEQTTGGQTPDGKVDSYGALIRYDRGEIHFQDLTPFCPSGFWDGGGGTDFITYPLPDSGSYRHCDLYTKTESVIRSQSSYWSFNTEFRGSRSVYDLGPLVLEGSEEVILNGVHLQRGTDYTIDYMSGQLRILNAAAKAENADLEILYESGTLFQLERKTLLGLRAQYALWENSYIGGMWLYLNEKPLEKRVRVGAEPIRNTLYDFNTSLTFRPYFLTRAVDLLPLVTTETPSEVKVDAEVARVYPNPNSMENRATGDVGGLAYLDDFESARRSVPLGILRRQWSLSSIPADPGIDSLRGRMIWYNPTVRQQVPVKEVFPEREVNENVANTLQSMNIVFRPDTTEGDAARSWGGVLRYLGEAYADQTLSKFLEIWVKWKDNCAGNDEGRLVVDIGQVSEDALADGQMSTEDRPEPGQPHPGDSNFDPRWEYGNGIINGPQEDTGIDGIALPDPQDSAYWNGPTRPKIPSWDDWNYSAGSDNFENINGTQGNLNDESGNYPDTEDLNNNQVLDIQNNYFSYDFWLSDTCHYVAGGQTNRNCWRLFRIPLAEYSRKIGNPTMTQIRSARLYLTGMSGEKRVEIVQLDIVGNEWQQIFRGDSVERVSVAVINNHENPGYVSPPGVQGEVDPISGVRTKEQSLALKIDQLHNNPLEPYRGEGWLAKNLYTNINLLEYRRLKMFTHGGGVDPAIFPEDKLELVLRLGQNYSDIFNNYYDIIKEVSPNWASSNTIDIALNDLTKLKTLRDAAPDTVDYYSSLLDSATTVAIKGNPQLSRIGFFALGVRITGDMRPVLDQEIWVDELRVSEIYKDPGTAADVSSQVKLADLATINVGYETRDADFHNVNTRIGDQWSRQAQRASASIALDKFFVGQWGIRLPLSMNYSQSEQTPKYFPNSDFRINPDHAPDSIKTTDQDYGFQTSFSRTGSGKSPWLNYTIDRLSGGYSFSQSKGSSFSEINNRTKSQSGNLAYSLPLDRGKGVAPFFFLRGIPFVNKLGSTRFYYMPTKFNTGIDAGESSGHLERRDGVVTDSRTFFVNRTVGTGFNFFEPLSMDYGRTIRSDLSGGDWGDLTKLYFGRSTDMSQNFSSLYNPSFVPWLRSNFNYGANYHWSRGNLSQRNAESISTQRTLGADFQLDLYQLLGEAKTTEQQESSPKGRGGAALPLGESSADSLKSPSDTTRAAAPPSKGRVNPLQALLNPLRKVSSILDPITLGYQQGRSHSQSATLGQADWRYQFGLTQNPGTDTVGGYVQVPSITKSDEYDARTGLRISKNIRFSLTHSVKLASTISNASTGTREQTVFYTSDKQGKVTALPFFDWTFDWSGLASTPLFNKVAESVSLNNALSGRIHETWTGSASRVTGKSYTRQWNPLVGINITWKGGVDSQIRYNRSNTFDDQVQTSTKKRSSDQQISLTVGYSIRTGFSVPLIFIKRLRLTNQTNLSLSFDYRSAKAEYTPSGAFTVQSETSSWNLTPRLTYTFSNAVDGQIYTQISTNNDKIPPRKSRSFEFGVQVNVAIRG